MMACVYIYIIYIERERERLLFVLKSPGLRAFSD